MADNSILQLPYAAGTAIDAATLRTGELVYDSTNAEIRYGDGATVGGLTLGLKGVGGGGADPTLAALNLLGWS